jgi:hypothetical protein
MSAFQEKGVMLVCQKNAALFVVTNKPSPTAAERARARGVTLEDCVDFSPMISSSLSPYFLLDEKVPGTVSTLY